jgi:pyruvate, water dikinase
MSDKSILKGIGASQGAAEGVVRIFMPGTDHDAFNEGEILVTTLTDPTMVQAMVKAAAIVTDIGGITSHPAILSREMGIPCVVNTKEATKVLKDGSRIRVDGSTGEIYELD